MANVLGLFTKQEAKEVRDINLLNDGAKLRTIAHWIYEVQQIGDNQTKVIINMPCHEDVAKYFKNTVGYDVVQTTAGQPAGYTIINEISWL